MCHIRPVQGFSLGQYFGHVARHFHTTPFLTQHAFLVDQEGAAINAKVFLAVQLLELDHVEQLADRLVLVRNQLERERLLGLEVFVGLQAVAGHAQYDGVGSLELRDVIAKVLALRGAARRVVFRIEIDHHLLALEL